MSCVIEDENHSKCLYFFILRIKIAQAWALSSIEDKCPKFTLVQVPPRKQLQYRSHRMAINGRRHLSSNPERSRRKWSVFFSSSKYCIGFYWCTFTLFKAFSNFWLWSVGLKILLNVIVIVLFLKTISQILLSSVNTLMSAISSKKVYFYIQDSVASKMVGP